MATDGVEILRGVKRAKGRFKHEFGELSHGCVGLPDTQPGVIEVFVQQWEDPRDHTPDEARELAYDLLAAADMAESDGES